MPVPHPAAPRAPSPDAFRRTILAVDDEPSILEWLARSLDVFHYDVLPADTVPLACNVLRSARVDALILDVRMPGHSGLEVLEFVRSSGRMDLPVIILTGVSSLTAEEEEIIRRHRAYVFYKPEGVDELVATLDRLLH